MNQRDNFAGGLLLGSVVGAIFGGVVGVLLTSRRYQETWQDEETRLNANASDAQPIQRKPGQLKAAEEARIETARRSLEDKIAQLNETIDEVRQQLGTVNGNLTGNGERRLSRESSNGEF